jgi:hypothetical protein
MERDIDIENDFADASSVPSTAGILWETYRNNVGNNEQNEENEKTSIRVGKTCVSL